MRTVAAPLGPAGRHDVPAVRAQDRERGPRPDFDVAVPGVAPRQSPHAHLPALLGGGQKLPVRGEANVGHTGRQDDRFGQGAPSGADHRRTVRSLLLVANTRDVGPKSAEFTYCNWR